MLCIGAIAKRHLSSQKLQKQLTSKKEARVRPHAGAAKSNRASTATAAVCAPQAGWGATETRSDKYFIYQQIFGCCLVCGCNSAVEPKKQQWPLYLYVLVWQWVAEGVDRLLSLFVDEVSLCWHTQRWLLVRVLLS